MGKAVQQVGMHCEDATPVLASGDSSAGVLRSLACRIRDPMNPSNIHIPMADARLGSLAPAWGWGELAGVCA